MKQKKPKYYLIFLQGQGDTQVKVVDQETWDWIFSGYNPPDPHPGKNSYEDKTCPPAILERYKKANGEDAEEPFPCVSVGSTDNDRALYAPGIYFGKRHLEDYTSLSEATDDIMAWKKLLGIKHWASTYEGYIY